jgi:hypothetical protein
LGSTFFAALCLPLRIPYWIEEAAKARGAWGWTKLALSFLSAMVPALLFL